MRSVTFRSPNSDTIAICTKFYYWCFHNLIIYEDKDNIFVLVLSIFLPVINGFTENHPRIIYRVSHIIGPTLFFFVISRVLEHLQRN